MGEGEEVWLWNCIGLSMVVVLGFVPRRSLWYVELLDCLATSCGVYSANSFVQVVSISVLQNNAVCGPSEWNVLSV
jgi:hypothetical protein